MNQKADAEHRTRWVAEPSKRHIPQAAMSAGLRVRSAHLVEHLSTGRVMLRYLPMLFDLTATNQSSCQLKGKKSE